MADESTIKPGTGYYALAALLVVCGVLGCAGFFWWGLGGLGDDLTQVLVPGSTTLNLKDPGDYTIFHEYRSVMNGKVYSNTQGVDGLQLTLTNKTTGQVIPLSQPMGHSTYNYGGRSGSSVFDFTITQPGAYDFSGAYPPGQPAPQAVFAIGQGFMLKLMVSIFGSLCSGFGGAGLGAVIGLVTLIKRSNAKKALLLSRE